MSDTENTQPEQPADDQDPDEVPSHPPEEGPRPDDAVEYEANKVGQPMNKEDE